MTESLQRKICMKVSNTWHNREGVCSLDKKKVPVLGIAASSGSGKTAFLRWIFNECCSFNPDAGKSAIDLLRRINEASPHDVPKLGRLLVLFASFNQKSLRERYASNQVPVKSSNDGAENKRVCRSVVGV